jgi:predicted nucleic acid-binding protein
VDLRVCLDSNVFIAIKDNEVNALDCEKIIDAIETKKMEGVVSAIVLSEVEVGYYMNNEYSDAQAFALKITNEYIFVPVLDDVAIEGAKIRALTGMRLPDALISASAQKTQCDFLITTDIPLFKKSKYKIINPTDFANQQLP